MSKVKKAMRRPCHETIVDLIGHAHNNELELVAWFIKMTKIPKGIDAVIKAWEERCEHAEDDHGLLADTLFNLNEQKREAEAEEFAKKQTAEAEARAVAETEHRLLREDALER